MIRMTRSKLASMVVLGLTALASQVSPAHAWTSTQVASDGFDRTVSSGWGSAPSGGSSTTSSGATSSRVAHSQALLNLAAGSISTGSSTSTTLTTTTATSTTTSTTTTSTGAGAATIGTASYTVPSGAIYVAPGGSNSAAGTQSAPLATLGAAISKAGSGATIVLRAGNYHESVQVPASKALTIENYPGEKVWLDGASGVSGFTASGSRWVRNNWTTQFDSSPTFTRGAADGTSTYWQFVNPSYPMAAHPDQVWINGTALTQVSSPSQVTSGTFAVDYTNHQLWVGTNPSGASVTASTINHAITVLSSGTTIRGIGVRNYADSVPDMGAVTAYGTNLTLENVAVLNSATVGVGIYRSGGTLRHVTVGNSGMLGVHGNEADNLLLSAVKVTGSNSQHFNTTPAAGAIKLSACRTVTLRDSLVQGNLSNAFWTDESSYDIAVVHNQILDNQGRGVFLELSQKASVVGNVIAGSTDDQIRIANTAYAQVWNNTVVGSKVALHVAQDSRTPSNSSYAVDTRRPSPDPEMTWVITGTTIGNNVFQATGSISALVLVEDWTKARTGSQLVSSMDGDLFSQPVSGQPTWVVAWANAANNPGVYTTLSAFHSAQGKEGNGRSRVGSSAVTSSYALVSGISGTSAVTLPSDVAQRAGISQRATLGAW